MRGGQFNRRVTVQKRTITKGASGEDVESWAEERKLWMSKRDIGASERIAAGGELAAEIQTIFCTWFPLRFTIAPDENRLEHGGRIYQIHGVKEIGSRKFLELSCSARAEAL